MADCPLPHHLTRFEVGQVKAYRHFKLGPSAIHRLVLKNDGETTFSAQAIADCIAKLEDDLSWRGERDKGSGAPRKSTKTQDKELYREVVRSRGRRRVTVQYLRTVFPWTRGVSNDLIEDRLHDAGLRWLRRSGKWKVPEKYLAERISYCHSTMRKHYTSLLLWAYADGTTFYLDRTKEENEETLQRALGGWVWRQSCRREALFQENLSASTYRKGQGVPVRVWGMLAEGRLNIHVLDQGENMHEDLYLEMVDEYYEQWLGGAKYLVVDFEKCLRTEGALSAYGRSGVTLVEGYPRQSQDFNAIENCWKLLRERLTDTLPQGIEARADFIVRLGAAVAWLNKSKRDRLKYLSLNQKERCRDCLTSKPPGGRTKW